MALGHIDKLRSDLEFSCEDAQTFEIISIFIKLKRVKIVDINFLKC